MKESLSFLKPKEISKLNKGKGFVFSLHSSHMGLSVAAMRTKAQCSKQLARNRDCGGLLEPRLMAQQVRVLALLLCLVRTSVSLWPWEAGLP